MDGFQCLHLNAFQRVRHLVQQGTVEPPEFLDPGCISAERIGFGESMEVSPQFHSLPLKTVLRRGNVSLCLCYTSRDCEKCSHNCLRSHPLDSIDQPDCLILARVHPDTQGIVHHRRHYQCEQLPCRCWGQAAESLKLHRCL
jgi:hypothetical protein